MFVSIMFLLFFFQAEDGIRDTSVTGVQTCALPISSKYLAIYCAAVRVSPSPESWGWLFFLRAVVAEREGASSCPVLAGPGSTARLRSEERRVGKEWRYKGSAGQ